MSLKDKFYKLAYFLLRVYCKIFCFAPYACTVAIIRKREKVLLINQSDGLGYGLPGGIVKYGEQTEEALVREVLEETGYKIKIKNNLGSVDLIPGRAGTNNVVIIFEAEIVGGNLKESLEGCPGFYNPEKVELNSDARVILKKFLEF